ncbi:hypothetical protein Cni_G23643 [Canna indica]|uniref:Uncharacterized protein n=1 Tax=Canna indica TaxID=4628 RepID=A0AAQ3KTI5_9LILI|nr:hypothetical protein Cni_G23643 [Canna indica]
MSWLRSAVNKAVEVGGNNNLTRTVRSYAGSVVHHAGQAVVGGARIIQGRMGIRQSQSFKQTAKRLEDTAVSCRGIERVQLLQRWLFALQETRKAYDSSMDHKLLEQPPSSDESNLAPENSSLVLYFDSEMGDEPMSFWDVFLYSQALEGITLSMILEAPNDEEISLLLQIFGHCLTGGKEVHNTIISSIQDLSKAFSTYEEEVLVKREELLQFAQNAISGLKLNADIARLEYEASKLQQKVGEMEMLHVFSGENHVGAEKRTLALEEALKEALAEFRICSRLEDLLLKQKCIKPENSMDIHSQNVDKLKVLAESLANSSLKAEKRILDHRHQKEEALNFRVVKANETRGIEKELLSDIGRLENQRDALEAELKKVNVALVAACGRLKKTREEKDQFDEASNQIIMHLKAKEDDLAKSVTSCKVEADIVRVWINFLEDAWKLQSSYRELKDKQIGDELEKYGNCFVKSIKHHLSSCKDELKSSITHISKLVENLKKFSDRPETEKSSNNEISEGKYPRKNLEEEYLATETKIVTAFSIVNHMEELFYSEREEGSRRDDPQVNELFESIEKMRLDFESIERPLLEIETVASPSAQKIPTVPITSSPKPEGSDSPRWMDEISDTESEITQMELEYGKTSTHYYPAEDILGWEFDDFVE